MRRVDRGRAPSFVSDPDFILARSEYERFRAAGGTRATQTVFDFAAALGRHQDQLTTYVDRLFLGKCAYTEAPTFSLVHLHRPEADAYDERGEVSADHYWWTAMWYRNWYLASEEVVARKRTNFPLLGPRAPMPELGGRGVVDRPHLYRDRGALLDPCEDHPQLHLRFRPDGTVDTWSQAAAPWLSDDEVRGYATIDLLGLNSPQLTHARRDAIDAALARFELDLEPTPDILHPGRPHIGAVRQVLAERLLAASPQSLSQAQRALAPELVPHLAQEAGRYPTGLLDAVRASVTAQSQRALARVLDNAPSQLPPGGRLTRPRVEHRLRTDETVDSVAPTAAISRVRISNFQAIGDFDFTFPASPDTSVERLSEQGRLREEKRTAPTRRPWWVLLGENGAGKSSVLKAVALALAGTALDELVRESRLEWSEVLRRGTSEGRVVIDFLTGPSVDLRFTMQGAWFEGGPPRMGPFIRGFGATRLLEDANSRETNVRLGNLFDPRIPVIDAEQWLLSIPDERDFNAVAVSIARLVDREQEVAERNDQVTPRLIERRNGTVTVGGDPLRSLSDGYRAVIATACDLMAGAGTGLSDMRNASGIVLLDELGSHLHPRWKMKITRTLRDVFPSMQFIVTTHDPLCLRGLAEREVIGVRTSPPDGTGRSRALFDLVEQSPSRLRVDQLLTSEFFGLDTTIDPEVDEQFQRYYAMVRRDDPEEVQERLQLRAELSRHGVLGYTARDQLVYEAIDQFLANEREMDPETRAERRRETLRHVGDIWRNVAARRTEDDRP